MTTFSRIFQGTKIALAIAVLIATWGTAAAAVDSHSPPHVSQLRLQWEHPLYAAVSATPVVADEQLFVAAENGNVYAFDLRRNKQLWLYHTEGAITSTPAVAEGRIYFLSRDGYLYALEQTSGKFLWRFATRGQERFAAVGGFGTPPSNGPVPDPWDFYSSSPLVKDGKVYFGSTDRHVYALDAVSGKLIWSFNAQDPVHSSPAYGQGRIVIGTWGTRIYALDAQTGAEIWRFQGGVDRQNSVMLGITASPRLDEDAVYFGARDGFAYALNLADGKPRWRYDAQNSWILSSAAVDAKAIYLSTSDTGLLLALDKKTGAEIYRANTRIWTYASPLILREDYLVTGTMAGELYVFAKATGEPRWYYQTPAGRADVLDIIDDHSGKFRSEKLFGPHVQMQAAVENVKALGAFVASPVWADERLITVDANGFIRIFVLPQSL